MGSGNPQHWVFQTRPLPTFAQQLLQARHRMASGHEAESLRGAFLHKERPQLFLILVSEFKDMEFLVNYNPLFGQR